MPRPGAVFLGDAARCGTFERKPIPVPAAGGVTGYATRYLQIGPLDEVAGRLEVSASERIAPKAQEVQIAVGSAGICGSDLHSFRGDFDPRVGRIPGHEISGTVSALPSGIRHVREGDVVGIEPLTRCGICRFCMSGDYNICADRGLIGAGTDGGMSEFVNVPANTVYRVPSGVDTEVGALAEPLACSVHGFERVRLKGAETVLIVGAGTIGLTAILAARARGARVLVLARHRTSVRPPSSAVPTKSSTRARPARRAWKN